MPESILLRVDVPGRDILLHKGVISLDDYKGKWTSRSVEGEDKKKLKPALHQALGDGADAGPRVRGGQQPGGEGGGAVANEEVACVVM